MPIDLQEGVAWHLLDTSLINYFPKEDGTIAGLEDVTAAAKAWYDANPGYLGDNGKLDRFHRAGGWTGGRQGPALLAGSPFYDWSGWWPAKTHSWTSTMIEYDGRHGTPFAFEYGYSQGYEVNVQLRPGERLTRNWFHNGLHLNGVAAGGKIQVLFSDNNGRDWREVASVSATGEQTVDLGRFVLRRYDYRLRLVLRGAGTGLQGLRIRHDIQCSQRALPTLDKGQNTIAFSAGPHQGTVSIQGCSTGDAEGKQVQPFDFHPQYDGVTPREILDLEVAPGGCDPLF